MERFLKLFAIVLLAFGIFILSGCTEGTKPIAFKETENFKTLNHVTYPNLKAETNPVSDDVVAALKTFAVQTVPNIFEERGKNHVYSPLSLYMALAMLLEGVSDEEARQELEGLLGMEREESRAAMKTVYENNFYKNKNGTLRLANSIWFKKNYPIEEEYLRILAEDYYAESYQTLFDSEGHQNIIDWINHYTENFLELTRDKFAVDANTVILLLNTIYFHNKWKTAFEKYRTQAGDFHSEKGAVSVQYMRHSVDGKYKRYVGYGVAEDYFENNASVTYILPDEGVDVYNLLTPEVLISALDPADKSTQKIDFSVPKFKYFSEFQLNEALNKLGVEEVFNSGSNSLELMSRGRGLFVSEVKQNAGIEFSEEGVKAAAVTGVIIKESAVESVNFRLDRPFIYIIKDAFGIPLFMGLVQNPAE